MSEDVTIPAPEGIVLMNEVSGVPIEPELTSAEQATSDASKNYVPENVQIFRDAAAGPGVWEPCDPAACGCSPSAVP